MMTTSLTTSFPFMEMLLEENSQHTERDNDTIIIKYISDRTLYIALNVVMITFSGFVSVLGNAANVINIIIFIRQGVFSESSNVSLLGLSVADFLCVLTMLWTSVTYAMAIHTPPDLTWDPFDILYMSGAWPRLVTGLITRVVTAFVALERCVCVVFPFKVKSIFTPKSSSISIICIFVYFLISYSPVYYYNQFRYSLDPETNVTHLKLVSLSGFIQFQAIVSFINLFIINFGSVAIVLICTMITISRVKMSTAWRESCATTGSAAKSENTKQQLPGNNTTSEKGGNNATQPNKMSATRMKKEKKLINMITFISIIFLVCYIPNLANAILYGINDQITTSGENKNLAWLMYCFIFLSETINSSINIIVYYKMSSRFKQEFDRLFGIEDIKG